jgi:hypothetical protein
VPQPTTLPRAPTTTIMIIIMQQKVVVHCSLPGDSVLSCSTPPLNGTYLKRKKKVLIGYRNYTWHQGTICDEIQVSKLLLEHTYPYWKTEIRGP